MRAAVSRGGRISPGPRTVVGVLLVAGGILGFLPVLGSWMIPLGLVLIALDLRHLGRRGADILRSPGKQAGLVREKGEDDRRPAGSDFGR